MIQHGFCDDPLYSQINESVGGETHRAIKLKHLFMMCEQVFFHSKYDLYFRLGSSKVLPDRISPESYPFLNHSIR
ncbi:Uncharacterised protein [Sphingobacterium multivorum]|jgi:hypothetical protein|uniref:Uncharacterized protein n=1 Tax=Sphingobacterium multivorum TaxID=28454 RepID=A0A2X2KT53_SPHMU|nr:Uncharacterised protein [Sphingobacterium multivorum]SUJ21589.1 Uncharacterised protein [Sphingobacterium multivorum]